MTVVLSAFSHLGMTLLANFCRRRCLGVLSVCKADDQGIGDGLSFLYLSPPMMYRDIKNVVLTFGESYLYSGENHDPCLGLRWDIHKAPLRLSRNVK